MLNNYEKERQIVEWLEDYKAYKAGIENLKQLEKDFIYEGMGVDTTKEQTNKTYKFNSETENKVLKIDKFDIEHKIKVMQNIVNSIDRALQSLTDVEKNIIISRCMKKQYYYEFCYEVCASERTAKRIKKEALRKMSIVIFGKE